MERMIRRWESLSADFVQNAVDSSSPDQYAVGGLQGIYRPPFTEKLIEKKYKLDFPDVPSVYYEFKDMNTLVWYEISASRDEACGKNLAECHEEFYQGHEFGDGIFFILHMLKGSVPPQNHILVLDTNTGLATMVHAQFGNGIEAREIARSFHFGTIAGYDSYPQEKHHFTSDLVGTAINWVYHEGMPPLKHIYSSEYYYSYVMKFGDRCWMASNPADFVKITDKLYIFSFLEERQTGCQGLFLINMETLHDVGSFLSINSDNKFECYTVGAKGELTTMWTHLA